MRSRRSSPLSRSRLVVEAERTDPGGCALGRQRAADRAVRHGSTFGGNDLAAAAALATLRVLECEQLVERAERMGKLLLELTSPLMEILASRAAVRMRAAS